MRRSGGTPGTFKRGVIESVTDELGHFSSAGANITTVLGVQYDDGTCAERVVTEETMWRVACEEEIDSQATETDVDSQATETESDIDA